MNRQVLSYNSEQVHNTVAKNIQEAWRTRNISRTKIAKIIGVSAQQYHKYETGINRVSAVTLQQLAVFFNIDVRWFFQEANASCSAPDIHPGEVPIPTTDPAQGCGDTADDAKHILLVDDEPDVRRLTGSFLRKAGFRVSEAAGGDDVLARLASGERFDALVTDYAMAGVSGLGLIEIMREIAPALPVLVVTGHSRDRDLIFALPPKVQILAKPYSRNLFLAYIERLVGLPHKANRLKEDVEVARQI